MLCRSVVLMSTFLPDQVWVPIKNFSQYDNTCCIWYRVVAVSHSLMYQIQKLILSRECIVCHCFEMAACDPLTQNTVILLTALLQELGKKNCTGNSPQNMNTCTESAPSWMIVFHRMTFCLCTVNVYRVVPKKQTPEKQYRCSVLLDHPVYSLFIYAFCTQITASIHKVRT